MLTRLRNASAVKRTSTSIIGSAITLRITDILKKEGFIESFDLHKKKNKFLIFIKLRYKGLKQQPYIANLTRISKPGLRVYTKSFSIPKVLGGVGIAVYSSWI